MEMDANAIERGHISTRLKGLDAEPLPEYLRGNPSVRHFRLPLENLLRDSLYYPASGRDGSPVACLNGFVHSFVYADYGLRPREVRMALCSPRHGFKGYRPIGIRPVWKHEVFQRRDPDPPPGWRLCRRGYWRFLPIGLWALLERQPYFQPGHGPLRFSFLFLRADGVSTYRRFYNAHGVAPKVLALICPGHAFGWNWTNFCDSFGPLSQVARRNPEGLPRHILYDGDYARRLARCCWHTHDQLMGLYHRGGKRLALWRCGDPVGRDQEWPSFGQCFNPYEDRFPDIP